MGMRRNCGDLRVLCALALVAALTGLGTAAELRVGEGEPYATIGDAMRVAQSGDTVTVARGDYDEKAELKPGVILQGEEAAFTTLKGGVSAVSTGTLQRFTITGTGLLFSDARRLVVRGNIFRGLSKALDLEGCTEVDVSNNTFYGNTEIAIQLTGVTGNIARNIFAQNGTAVSYTSGSRPELEANHYFDNRENGETGVDPGAGNPLFVAPAGGDFHLKANSPAIDPAGPDGDAGAYGGPARDPLPFPVSGVTAKAASAGNSVDLTWAANQAYDIAGYTIYYGPEAAPPYGGGKFSVDGPQTTAAQITGLTNTAPAPPAPTGVAVGPGQNRLHVTWSAADGASGYRVKWGTVAGDLPDSADAGAATEYEISGLSVGIEYRVAVQSYAGTTYHFSVTARTQAAQESDFSGTVKVSAGATEGGVSAEVTGTPGEVAGFPDLEDKGACFLRTAQPRGVCLPAFPGWAGLLAVALVAVLALRRRLALALLLCALASTAARAEHTRWTVAAKGGALFPGQDDWDDHYDSEVLFDAKLGAGFRPWAFLEVGAEAGYRRAEGKVKETLGGEPLDPTLDQTLSVYPVQIYLQLDFRVQENQRLIPYIAGGYSRYYYWQSVEDGPDADGYLSGYHVRGGLKYHLNPYDPEHAARARQGFGLVDTYLCLEAQFAKVDDFGDEDADLGGWSTFMGVVLDF